MRFLNKTSSKMLAVGLVTGAMGLSAGLALAAQPDMEGALHALESAQAHLNKVSQDKGGHANTARKLVSDAIEEVQKGIEFGRSKGE